MARNENARIIGMVGEAIAERYLSDQGMILIERNWRSSDGELDLIFKDPRVGEMVFVEVKSRSSGRFGSGSEAISEEKYRRLHRLAHTWLRNRGIVSPLRIDVISIDGLILPRVSHIRRVIL